MQFPCTACFDRYFSGYGIMMIVMSRLTVVGKEFRATSEFEFLSGLIPHGGTPR